MSGRLEIEIELDESWKGESPSKISFMTYKDGDACGSHFTVESTYLVFAYADEAQNDDGGEVLRYLSTNWRTHNRKIDDSSQTKSLLLELDELKSKTSEESGDESREESEVVEDS